MEEMNQEFTAYLRRLLRDLEDVENALKGQETERALEMVKRLREDIEKDIDPTRS